jgi:hypothetical protein
MKIMKIIFYNLIIFIVFLVILEISFRSVVYLVHGPEKVRSLLLMDRELGWIHNTSLKKKRRSNRCGENVVTLPPRHELINKFPRYSGGTPVLFIGDSFTHAHEVSTGKAYYDVFAQQKKNNYSVYAVGIGGYGNLQEYMALKSIYKEVKPHIVVWQLTSNDINNNIYELDNSSFYNNQRPRPYLNLNSGEIEMRNPGFWLFDWSHGFYNIFEKLLLLDWKYEMGLLRKMNSTIALNVEDTKKYTEQGLAVLDFVIGDAVQKYPQTIFLGFSVDQSYDKQFETIFRKNGAEYISQFYKFVNGVEKTNCAPLDAHWNHFGNEVVGKKLSMLLREFMNTEK